MKDSDICFYMSVTKEENSACIITHPNTESGDKGGGAGGRLSCAAGAEAGNGGGRGGRKGSSSGFSRVANMIAGVGKALLYIIAIV